LKSILGGRKTRGKNVGFLAVYMEFHMEIS